MTVAVLTPPAATRLTQLTSVKEELIISGVDDDDFIGRLIDEASETVTHWACRALYRAQFRETTMGNQKTRYYLGRYPVASLDAVTYSSSAMTDVSLEVAETGALYRQGSFGTLNVAAEWTFDYTAGWFLPGEDITGSIDVDAADDSYNSSALFHPHLKAGDILLAQDFSTAANNGYKRVVTATTSKIVVDSVLTTEVSATRTLALRTLPGWIERACIDLVALSFNSRDRDAAVESIHIGDASLSFASKSSDPISNIRHRVQSLARAA